MNNPYNHTGYTDSEEVAREKELANILWQFMEAGKADRAARLKQADESYLAAEKLRAKLTSWQAMVSKRYEVARALVRGWWNQLTMDEQRCIVDGSATAAICVVLIVVFGWLSMR